jgi:ribose transport system ATP-binding protein
LNDPTRGVDEATKQEIHNILRREAERGVGILWYSTENAELEKCDRIYIMRDQKVFTSLAGGESKGRDIEREIIHASFGSKSLPIDGKT